MTLTKSNEKEVNPVLYDPWMDAEDRRSIADHLCGRCAEADPDTEDDD